MKACSICFLLGVVLSSGAAYVYIDKLKTEFAQANKAAAEQSGQFIKKKLKDTVIQTTEDAKRIGKKVIEGAKEKIHEATEPSD